jgi:hypothetical protein
VLVSETKRAGISSHLKTLFDGDRHYRDLQYRSQTKDKRSFAPAYKAAVEAAPKLDPAFAISSIPTSSKRLASVAVASVPVVSGSAVAPVTKRIRGPITLVPASTGTKRTDSDPDPVPVVGAKRIRREPERLGFP